MERTVRRLMSLDIPEKSLRSVALSNLAVGESYFFRDRETWEAIPKAVPNFRDLEILSIGCSEGEEVYTTSFVLKGWFKRILGLDADSFRIEKALRGTYTRWKLRGMSKSEISRYFKVSGEDFKVKDIYKDGLSFEVLNAFHIPLENKYDILFARRVMIYMNDEGVSDLVNRIHEILKDEGILVLGKGEVYWQVLEKFEPFPVGKAVFWKKRKRSVSDDMEMDMVRVSLSETESLEKIDVIKRLLNSGLYEEALSWSRSLKSDNSGNVLAWKYEILSLAYMGLHEEALKVLRDARKRFPNDDEIRKLERVLAW